MNVAVLAGATPLGRELAFGLADHGACVAVLGSDGDEAAVCGAIEAAGGRAAAHTSALASRGDFDAALSAVAAQLGSLDALVAPVLPGAPVVRVPLAEHDESFWRAACELPLLAARYAAQAAFRAMAPPEGRGGRIIFVAPTAALSGEPGLAAYATAAEGARAMARVVARGWGALGIALHWVGAPTHLFTGEHGAEVPRIAVPDPAFGRGPDVRRELAAVVASLASPSNAFLTGTTTVVDGGAVML